MAKKKIKEEKDYPQLIHIKAESSFISVNALVPENKAESVLTDVRDNFKKHRYRFDPDRKDTLRVQICVHNPKIF